MTTGWLDVARIRRKYIITEWNEINNKNIFFTKITDHYPRGDALSFVEETLISNQIGGLPELDTRGLNHLRDISQMS
jgi:hypothetical protein